MYKKYSELTIQKHNHRKVETNFNDNSIVNMPTYTYRLP